MGKLRLKEVRPLAQPVSIGIETQAESKPTPVNYYTYNIVFE